MVFDKFLVLQNHVYPTYSPAKSERPTMIRPDITYTGEALFASQSNAELLGPLRDKMKHVTEKHRERLRTQLVTIGGAKAKCTFTKHTNVPRVEMYIQGCEANGRIDTQYLFGGRRNKKEFHGENVKTRIRKVNLVWYHRPGRPVVGILGHEHLN